MTVKMSLAAAAVALGVMAAPAWTPAWAEEAPVPAATPANATAAPSAADLLFEQPQMRNAAPGSTITYDYLRRSGIAKGPFGAPLQDTVTLKVDKASGAEKAGAEKPSADARDIAVTMFSGLNRVPAGPFEDMTGNPVVSLFLENHLRALAKVLEANPRYLKLAIRRGLRERAAVTPIKVKVGDREVEGWQVVTRPFVGDPLGERMRGLDDLTYTFVTSPAVPGEIVSMEAASRAKDGGELLEEKLRYDQKAG